MHRTTLTLKRKPITEAAPAVANALVWPLERGLFGLASARPNLLERTDQ
jgi:hypothetical protein